MRKQLRLDLHFTIGGNAAYLDAKYDDYPGGACLYNAPPRLRAGHQQSQRLAVAACAEMEGVCLYRGADTYLRGAGRLPFTDYTARPIARSQLFNSQPANTKFDARVALQCDDRWKLPSLANLMNKVTWGRFHHGWLETAICRGQCAANDHDPCDDLQLMVGDCVSYRPPNFTIRSVLLWPATCHLVD